MSDTWEDTKKRNGFTTGQEETCFCNKAKKKLSRITGKTFKKK